jgi:hypothetical protein
MWNFLPRARRFQPEQKSRRSRENENRDETSISLRFDDI